MKSAILALILFTLPAGARPANFGFVPGQSLTQTQERDFLEKQDFKNALEHWELAFGAAGNGFARSATGKALYSYILMQNNMVVIGLQKLFEIKNPEAIAQTLKVLLKKAVPARDGAWRIAHVIYTSKWNAVFSPDVGAAVEAWTINEISNDKDYNHAESLAHVTNADSNERAWLEWQMAIYQGLKNNTKVASDLLQSLLDSEQTLIGQDQIVMASARLLYQDGKLDGALRYYNMVPKSSDFWLESVEEKAWTFLRKDEPEKTLGQLQTVLIPLFAPQTGPEPYFLQGLTELKMCNYYGVFKDLKEFKGRYRSRIPELEKLADTGRSAIADQAIDKIEKHESILTMGSLVENLPRHVAHDEIVVRAIETQRRAKDELNLAPLMLKGLAQKNLTNAQNALISRLKVLASADLDEMSKILRKLNILEVEAIQRTHLGEKLSAKSTAPRKGGADSIEFPYDGEVWLDELDHYQVNAKSCPTHPESRTAAASSAKGKKL